MEIARLAGYTIHLPTSGGKAGTGHNRTSSLQIRLNNRILKQFRFVLANQDSRRQAVRRAKLWIETHPIS